MKNKQPIYKFNEDTGIASCILKINNKFYYGTAFCHSDDRDFMSEKVGFTIAEARARIQYLIDKKEEEKIALAALKQFYYSVNRSQQHDNKNYESRMLQRQIKFREENLSALRELIALEREDLADYINTKEELYQSVRRLRKGENTQDYINNTIATWNKLAEDGLLGKKE